MKVILSQMRPTLAQRIAFNRRDAKRMCEVRRVEGNLKPTLRVKAS